MKETAIICTMCNKLKPITQYYKHRTQCKTCVCILDKQQRLKEIEEQGGSKHVPQQCGVYRDEYQRANTMKVLLSMGWLYNEKKNIFYKPPIKDENGEWHFTRPHKVTIKEIRDKYDGFRKKVTIDTLPKFKYKNKVRNAVSEDLINTIIKEHIIDGITVRELSEKYKINHYKITQWVVSIMQQGLNPKNIYT